MTTLTRIRRTRHEKQLRAIRLIEECERIIDGLKTSLDDTENVFYTEHSPYWETSLLRHENRLTDLERIYRGL